MLCAGQIVLPPPPSRVPPGTSLFWRLPRSLNTLFFPCSALHEHSNQSFFQCPPFFITHIFPSTPGQPLGGWGQNNLTGALCDVGQVLRCRNDKADMTNQGQYNERYTVSILSLDKQMNDATKLTQRSEQIP